jgi:hypothetical protein
MFLIFSMTYKFVFHKYLKTIFIILINNEQIYQF